MELTSADAALLIELYIKATKEIIELTPSEVAQLRQDLAALAAKAVTRQSADYTFSACGALEAGPDGDSASGDPVEGG
jgi:hypothetical protein